MKKENRMRNNIMKNQTRGLEIAREKAIEILESIAEYMGNEEMFDCKNGNTIWYDLEDRITDIIKKK
jgi:hypothetical protein